MGMKETIVFSHKVIKSSGHKVIKRKLEDFRLDDLKTHLKIMNTKKISVVVPVYNEIDNIKLFHQQLLSTLSKMRQSYEIIYVDDNSSDGTWELLQQLSHQVIKSSGYKVEQKDSRGRMRAPGQDQLDNFQHDNFITVVRKVGKKGKAFSLKEGFDQATGSIFVMIDGDLQYPLSAIPQMVKKLDKADVVVAERKYPKDTSHQVIKSSSHKVRRIMSRTFRSVFGKFLFGLSIDIQSGLKAFTSQVYKTVNPIPKSGWTFDLEFLSKASNAGFAIDTVDITFAPRVRGESKVSAVKTSLEIGMNALAVRSKRSQALVIAPDEVDENVQYPMTSLPGGKQEGTALKSDTFAQSFGGKTTERQSMRGAGIGHKKKKYITHTTLPVWLSAIETFSPLQKLILLALPVLFTAGLVYHPINTLKILVAGLSVLYFIDTLFNLFVVSKSLNKEMAVTSSDKELRGVDEETLPMYTILCPLYKEAHVVPQFLEGIAALDWPKAKLDVMFLLEEDDVETIEAFNQFTLPYYARTVVVPHSMPKTKPKACNYGLSYAKGEYLVIYDAEDIPDTLQLKKAYLAFKKLPDSVQCLQAKLNFYNSRHNLLTRFFTAEYSLWFDVMLPGLQSLNSSLPLGGTSNHFKTKTLRELQGWDPFNVTEDADLGIRLFQVGYQTAVIDSTTYEEATSKPKIWFKQRSRWLKGYMQTYLVHMRHFGKFVKEKGLWHNIIFQMAVGGKILFILVNPLLWVLTILYFAKYSFFGPIIDQVYTAPISYFAVFSWIFGNFLFLYYYMIGAGKREQWDVIKYVFLIPVYWFMMSWAGMIGFWQLLFNPHYWEKTTHGFHLGSPKPVAKAAIPVVQPTYQPAYAPAYQPSLGSNLAGFAGGKAEASAKKFSILNFQLSTLKSGLPLLSMIGFDALMVMAVLPSERAFEYLLMSFFLKIAILLLQGKKVVGTLSKVIDNNVESLLGLWERKSIRKSRFYTKSPQRRILIFNWRDTKHVFAGGAEVYIDELAKRWVKDGNSVTMFCGNDHKNLPYEKIGGIEVYRRGGTYMVYVYAFMYYMLKFRGKYDVIIDCENGIPFFTPLFVHKPVILLVHHVHQEVFRAFLKFPLRPIAELLESKLMPFVYKNKTIVTVSSSSRQAIFNLGFTHFGNIEIIPNGVSSSLYVQYPKTPYPSFLYVGRLKEYKNIDVAIKAFARILKTQKDARFSVVGWGETYPELYRLVEKLQISHAVNFYGRVTDKQKAKFLSESWAAIQPSLIEGWGITVIEANAAGTPVIASRVSGLQDSVVNGETGMLVEKGNVKQFATAMQVIVSDTAMRERLSQNAVRWSQNFDWDKSANMFYRLIGRTIAGDTQVQPRVSEIFAGE